MEPTGRLRHPNLTLTPADCTGLLTALGGQPADDGAGPLMQAPAHADSRFADLPDFDYPPQYAEVAAGDGSWPAADGLGGRPVRPTARWCCACTASRAGRSSTGG